MYKGYKVEFVIDENGNPWFFAKQAALLLKYRNTNREIRKKVKENHYKRYGDLKHDGFVAIRDYQASTMFIDECGLYRLVFKSKMPLAEEFQDWVYDEVLPNIRQVGAYDSKSGRGQQNQQINNLSEYCENLEKYTIDKPPDDDKLHTFIVIEKNENAFKEPQSRLLNFPYYVLRRQKLSVGSALKRLKEIYPRSEVIFKFTFIPNAINFYNLMKAKSGVRWCGNHFGTYLNTRELIYSITELHKRRNEKPLRKITEWFKPITRSNRNYIPGSN